MYLKDGKIQRETKMAKPLKFKDFINVDYTQSGDDWEAYRAQRRHRHIPTGNTAEEKDLKFKDLVTVDTTLTGDPRLADLAQKRRQEALNVVARMKLARSLRKNKAKIAMGRKKAERKVASQEVLMKRARKQARNTLMKKITKDIPKDELSMARKQEIEKRLDKMKPRIDKIAKKLLPVVRKKELEKKRGGDSE